MESLHAVLTRLLTRLNPRDRFVICGRFGLGEENCERTFQSLAMEMGLSRERVRQLELRAMARLRNIAAEMGLDKSLGFS